MPCSIHISQIPVHGAIELSVAISMVACPWIFGFANLFTAKAFFVGSGIGLILVWSITDYRSAPSTRWHKMDDEIREDEDLRPPFGKAA